jgi:hypothetical protein
VPDGVRMVWAGRLKRLLKVISRLSCPTLEIALNYTNMFLIGVISLLVVVIFIIASGNYDPFGVPLWPPPTAFGSPLSAFAGSLGRCPSATNEERLSVALDENDRYCLFFRSMPCDDVKQLCCGPRLITVELMH